MKKKNKKSKISSNKAQENAIVKIAENSFDEGMKSKTTEIAENLYKEQENVAAQFAYYNNCSYKKYVTEIEPITIRETESVLKPVAIEKQIINISNSDIEKKLFNISNSTLIEKQIIDISNSTLIEKQIIDISNSTLIEKQIIDISNIEQVSKEWGNFYSNVRQCILQSISLKKKAELFSIFNSQKKYESCIEILNLCSEQDTNKQLEDFIEIFYGLEADKGLHDMSRNLQQLYDEKTYINIKNLNKGCDKFNKLCDEITNILKNCTPEELSKVNHELTPEKLVEQMKEVYESCSDKSVFKSSLLITWLKNSTKASNARTIFLDWARAPEAKELIDKVYSFSLVYIKKPVLEIFANKGEEAIHAKLWNNTSDKLKVKIWKTLDKDKKMEYFYKAKPELKIKLVKTIMNTSAADEINYFLSRLPEKDRAEILKDFTFSHLSEKDRAEILNHLSEKNLAKAITHLTLSHLSEEDRAEILKYLPKKDLAEFLKHFPKEDHAETLNNLSEKNLAKAITHLTLSRLSEEDRAKILKQLPKEDHAELLKQLPKEDLTKKLTEEVSKKTDISDIKDVSKKWDSLLQNEQKNILQLLSSEKKAELFSILNSQKKYESCIKIMNLCLGQDKSEDLIEHFVKLEMNKNFKNMNKAIQILYNERSYDYLFNWHEITDILKDCTPEELSKVHHKLTHENLVEQMNSVYEFYTPKPSSSFINWLKESNKASTVQTIFLDWACAPKAKELINMTYSVFSSETKQSVLEIFANKGEEAIHAKLWNNTSDKLKVKIWKTLDKDKKMEYFYKAKPELKIKLVKTIMNAPAADEINYFLSRLPEEDRAEILKDFTLSHLPKEDRAEIFKFASDLDQWSKDGAELKNQLSEEEGSKEDLSQLSEEDSKEDNASEEDGAEIFKLTSILKTLSAVQAELTNQLSEEDSAENPRQLSKEDITTNLILKSSLVNLNFSESILEKIKISSIPSLETDSRPIQEELALDEDISLIANIT